MSLTLIIYLYDSITIKMVIDIVEINKVLFYVDMKNTKYYDVKK
jgi:hypothetical protein